jgi:hypothetical protein
MMSDAYYVAQQELDKNKKDRDMATRGAGLTQKLLEASEVHAAGSSHCGEIKSKSAFSRYSTSLISARNDSTTPRPAAPAPTLNKCWPK